jgi:hypothetical protein
VRWNYSARVRLTGKDFPLDRLGHQVPPWAPLYNLLLPKLLDFFPRVAGEILQHILRVLAF